MFLPGLKHLILTGKKLNIAVILLVFASFLSYSQDTTKKALDTAYKPLKFILSDYSRSYINQNDPDTITRRRIVWYPLKTMDDLFSYLPGYYLRFMDVGQINQIKYNQMNSYSTAVLRNGRPTNDMFDGSIDLNIFSRNEVAEIELTNGYGNTNYNYPNVVNVIQRQIFQFRPYTEISFYQDRYENTYFDGDFHQNLFRNLNFNFGITKHSYDGQYDNSQFDKWLGRFNLNFAASSKLNLFAYINYSDIKRGLNEGIDPDTVDITNKEVMFNSSLAVVRYSRANEEKERFDIDAGAVYQAGKLSLTRLQLYESNSFREYYQISNLLDPSSPMRRFSFHWINYGSKVTQLFNFELKKELSIVSRTELDYSYLTTELNQSDGTIVLPNDYMRNSRLSYIEDVSMKYKTFAAGVYLKGFTPYNPYTNIFESSGLIFGAKASYDQLISESSRFRVSAMYNYDYFSGSVDFISNNYKLGVTYYDNKYAGIEKQQLYYRNETESFRGINAKINLKIFKFVLDVNHNYALSNELNETMPENSGRIDLSYDDNGFRNKLEYKVGLTSRYWQKHEAVYYSGFLNQFFDHYIPSGSSISNVVIPENFTLDFYIKGKIGRATFGLTLENFLNRLVYNTGVYPFMDRGGLFNVISRFNITWNFLD